MKKLHSDFSAGDGAPSPLTLVNLALGASLALSIVGATAARAQTGSIDDGPQPAQARQGAAPARINDPLEPINRAFFCAYTVIDPILLRPAATVYVHVAPRLVRTGVSNVLSNLQGPAVVINDALQLNPAQAGRSLARFAVNSTVGVAGLFDPATSMGLPGRENGFSKTLAYYRAPPGPYVFLISPSDVRGVIGGAVDGFADPLNYVSRRSRPTVGITHGVAALLTARVDADPEIKAVNAAGGDRYATVRALYFAHHYTSRPVSDAAPPEVGDHDHAAPEPAAQPEPLAPPEPAAPDASRAAPTSPAPTPGPENVGQTSTPGSGR